MDELVAFLRAQLDEDERVARSAIDTIGDEVLDTWHYEPGYEDGHGGKIRYAQGYTVVHQEDGTPDANTAEHIARWDPARVLAEVEAKRRILEQYADAVHLERIGHENDEPSKFEYTAREEALGRVVKLLAQPYAGREGWRGEWRWES